MKYTLCVSTRVYVSVLMCAHMCVCVCNPENNLGCHSSKTLILFLFVCLFVCLF